MTAPAENPISHLQKALDAQRATLDYDQKFGYLKAILKALKIPYESQVLVFSKTSLQNRRISPETPRAIYFNDDVYIGTVQYGDALEISTADPKLGTVFYTLSQDKVERPEFIRQDHNCLQCHESSLTNNIPGHLVRSVYVDSSGLPILQAGTSVTTDASALKDRWGGWYVTGTHGESRHMGNVIAKEEKRDASIDREAGANRTTVDARVDMTRYLAEHSDIVALMILGHQTHVHNLITEANYNTQYALRDQALYDNVLDRPKDVLSDSTRRRIASAGDDLLEALLLTNEAALPAPIKGTTDFATKFMRQGPRDTQGRSLRQLDLETRLFTYPLSYLIYTEQFSRLPAEMKDYLYQRLWNILISRDATQFPHITLPQRQALLEILIDTLPDFPGF
jgi:hypothetical protein